MEKKIRPLLKWVGGKRQLINSIIPLVPDTFSTYVEPFIGGGALFFALEPKKAIINDYNEELMNVYKVVRDNPEQLIEMLTVHKENFSKEYFYKVREYDRMINYNKLSNIKKAARFIFLNKTCFNGLYRVNLKGQFNTPIGNYVNPNIVNETLIRDLSNYLNSNEITMNTGNYVDSLKNLDKNSFVYLDPPYAPISYTSSFTSYTDKGFTKKDQQILKKECDKLIEQKIFFIQSNSDCEFIRNLYSEKDKYEYKIINVNAKRTINSNGQRRGNVQEVLISPKIK
ncbi:MAG: DNA adenine methylase [Sphaerochaeta sp.]